MKSSIAAVSVSILIVTIPLVLSAKHRIVSDARLGPRFNQQQPLKKPPPAVSSKVLPQLRQHTNSADLHQGNRDILKLNSNYGGGKVPRHTPEEYYDKYSSIMDASWDNRYNRHPNRIIW